MRPLFFPAILFALTLAFTGCDKDDKIVIYTTPKETSQPSPMDAMPPAAPAMAPSTANPTAATWTAPPTWQQEPEKPMRLASFTAGQSELIITQFAQDNIGGLLPNINRWRGMVGLPPVTDASAVSSKSIKVAGADGTLFDFTSPDQSTPAKRVLIAMIPDGANYWFFRLQGTASSVNDELANFNAFLNSVQFTDQTQHTQP